MLPTIGILIAGYVFLRCLEILATAEKIQSRFWRFAVALAALGVLLLSATSVGVLANLSASASQDLSRLP